MSTTISTLFILRAQHFDGPTRYLAATLKSLGASLVIAIDDRDGPADTGQYSAVSINDQMVSAFDLEGAPADWGWRCGDFCYYAVSRQHPDFSHYCLIESDVFVPPASAREFVQVLSGSTVDIMAARLGPQPKPPLLSSDLAKFGLDPLWGAIFPITRVSRAVVPEMYALRRQCIHTLRNSRLNDEAVLAGIAQSGRFSYAKLEEILPDLITGRCFNTNPPHLYEALVAEPNQRFIHHPVVLLETVLQRIKTGEKRYSRHRLRRILEMAAPDDFQRIIAALTK